MSPFQAINKVVQYSTSSAKDFLEGHTARAALFEQDDLDEWLTLSFNELPITSREVEMDLEVFRGLHDEVITSIVNCYALMDVDDD